MLKHLLVAIFLVASFVKAASADFVPAPPTRPALVEIVGGGMYKYGAAIVEDYEWKLMWWCKGESNRVDRIAYRSESGGKISTTSESISITVINEPTPGSGQGIVRVPILNHDTTVHICDPTVVRGNFKYYSIVKPQPTVPLSPTIDSSDVTYQFALYYTKALTADLAEKNKIYVAFSNDGQNWIGPENAVVQPENPALTNTYGVGQASALNRGPNAAGQQTIDLFYTDTTAGKVKIATSTDGINFSHKAYVTQKSNLPEHAQLPNWNNDFVIHSEEQNIYATIPGASVKGCPQSGYCWYTHLFFPFKKRLNATETYGFGFFRIPIAHVGDSTKAWEFLGWVDSNLTGNPQNFAPALRRNGYGDIASLNVVEAVFATGALQLKNAAWDVELRKVAWKATVNPNLLSVDSTGKSFPLQSLNRHANYGVYGAYWNTTGIAGPNYFLQGELGKVAESPPIASGSEFQPIFNCEFPDTPESNLKRFVSLGGNCGAAADKAAPVGVSGYIAKTLNASGTAPGFTKPLYGCNSTASPAPILADPAVLAKGYRYLSVDPYCEAAGASATLLGYIRP
jgi:hypothetical protein